MNPRLLRTLRAVPLLIVLLMRRLLREGLVLRSLVFPVALTAGTLLATLTVVWLRSSPPTVAATPGALDPDTIAFLEGYDLTVEEVADPRGAVFGGDASAGTDGRVLWTTGAEIPAALLESRLRERGGSWRLEPIVLLPVPADVSVFGTRIARLLGGIYALYGVVFGAGMVARDRDDGSLSAELALPISRWVPGFVRWAAGSLVLGAFAAASILLFDALIGVPGAYATCRHTAAACAGATAMGLFTVGRSGLRSGFGGSLALSLLGSFAIYVVGQFVPGISLWIPLASLGSTEGGWIPLAVAAAFGMLASWNFGAAE